MKMSMGYYQYFSKGWKYILPHNSESLMDVIEFIKKENPDVVSFAEIDGKSWRSKDVDQVDFISKKTNLQNSYFFQTRKVGHWINQGNAILTKYKVTNNRQIKLPGYGEKRYLCSVDIDLGGVSIKYYTTHLSTNKQINLAQRYFIVQKINEVNQLKILTGDFNVEIDSLHIIKNNTSMIDIGFKKTFPVWQASKTLDHIFVSEEMAVVGVKTYNDKCFSDHYPIGIDIVL
jgi:endonuclease/exonuclease/phosphatase family metal-dependent hydrolase